MNTYFIYISNPKDIISLDYALFTSPSAVVGDGSNGYQNLFDVILDAICSALDKVDGDKLDIDTLLFMRAVGSRLAAQRLH